MNKFSKILVGSFATLALLSGAYSASADTAKVSVISSFNAVLEVGKENVVRWETESFPKGAFVHINLIKKVSDNPLKYELVRQVATYSVNDGEEAFVPQKGDVGENISLEVTCAGSTRFKEGCVSGQSDSSFAIEASFGSNLAGALSAFFDKFLGIFIK